MEQLTAREKETLEKFTKYRKENPGATVHEVYKATGTNGATLHSAKTKAGLIKKPLVKKNKPGPKPGSKQKPKQQSVVFPKMQTIAVPEVTSRNFAVIICNSSNLNEVLNAIS